MLSPDSDIQLALDLVGVFAFALSGGLVAVRQGLDLVGVAVLAVVAGLGGGMIRDVFLGDLPPEAIEDWRLLTVAVLAGLLTFALHHRFVEVSVRRPRLRLGLITRAVRVLDAAGLAVFAVGGAIKAISFGAAPLACVIIGVITACGGGALRDLLAGQVPEVLRRELYAIPALLGSSTVVLAYEVGHLGLWVVWGSVMLVFVIRIVAVVLDLNAPTPFRTGDRP